MDMQRIIRFNEGFCFFYYGLLIVIKSLDEFIQKTNKILVDKGSEFYQQLNDIMV